MNRNLQTVESIYQAFGRKDIPAILETLSPQVRWQHWNDNSAQRAGVPYMLERRGPDGVMAFFKALGESVELHSFQVLDIASSERLVVAEVTLEYTARSTGKRFQDETLHLWGFDESGRVLRYQNYLDTAKHILVHGLTLPG